MIQIKKLILIQIPTFLEQLAKLMEGVKKVMMQLLEFIMIIMITITNILV